MGKYFASFVFVVALAILPWVLMSAYMKSSGVLVNGSVVEKRETFLLPGGDTAKHIFEITYEYRPLDSAYSETVVQRVDSIFYRSLHTGSSVRVRYSPSRLLRTFGGMGLYLEDASILSRLRYGPPDQREIATVAALVVAAIFLIIAYYVRSKVIAVIGAVIASICFPMTLIAACGVLFFPALFWASRRHPGKGYGSALIVTIALSVGLAYWRVPGSSSLPADSIASASATVRQVRVVDELWSDTWENLGHGAGEHIHQPFQMVELEFTPEGTAESVHALDRIDLNSVAQLHQGSSVRIQYSALTPDSVRIVGASRNYARQAVTYLFCLVYGAGGVIAFVFIPLANGIQKIFRVSPVLRAFVDPSEAMDRLAQTTKWSQLPNDDPRRRQMELFLRGIHRQADDLTKNSHRG